MRDLKSVTAAEAAAVLAWTALAGDDRVGGIVFDDTSMTEVRPQRSRTAAMQLLSAVTDRNTAMHADAVVEPAPAMLDQALAAAERLASHDFLVVIISDFDVDHEAAQRRMLRLARNNDVVGVVVHDPSATDLPLVGEFVISDGELQVELEGSSARRRVADFGADRIADVLGWQQATGATMLPLSTAEPALDQIRHLLGVGVSR
ncbi:MAG: hypothetical protein GKS06_02245 [Acidobacteria bacterium]|nr:hypothetical protein [Acidobacteriota bacterium]